MKRMGSKTPIMTPIMNNLDKSQPWLVPVKRMIISAQSLMEPKIRKQAQVHLPLQVKSKVKKRMSMMSQARVSAIRTRLTC